MPTAEDDDVDVAELDREPGAAARRSIALPLLLCIGGALGLLGAMILTIDRIRLLQDPAAKLACDLSPFVACGPVMESPAGALFGFPNPLLGIIGFSVLVTTGAVLLAGARPARWYHLGLQVGVVLAAVFITWLQTQSLYVIGALCLWCMLIWAVTIPIVVAVTADNLATGRLGSGPVRFGRWLRDFTPMVVGIWYLIVLTAIGLRFYRDFALLWFGVVW